MIVGRRRRPRHHPPSYVRCLPTAPVAWAPPLLRCSPRVVAQTLSNVYRDRGPRDAGGPRRPVLRLLLHAWRPAQVTSRHRLDDVDAIVFGRGEAGAERAVVDGRRTLTVRVPDPMMSSDHGRLVAAGDHWLLDDPRSKNGAVVAGRPCRAAPVHPGDLFELGHTLFMLDDEEAIGAPALDVRADELRAPEPELATFSPALQRDLAVLERVATSTAPVLLHGESGTGKEVWARALHRLSRRPGPLVAVHCGGLAAELIEAELFGHRKGAFSGALQDRPGYLRSADGGTLLLDEIGDLPAAGQVVLLRALQEREVVPVGDSRPVPVDLRVCAATHRDLAALVAAGTFRQDLYARLLGVTITLPPLRDRRGDLGLLIPRLLARIPGATGVRFTPAAAYALLEHDWPLNVRELERLLIAAVARATASVIDVGDLPDALAAAPAAGAMSGPAPIDAAGGDDDDPAERARLIAALERHGGNVAAVARELGKHREQVHRWLRRLGIDATGFRR